MIKKSLLIALAFLILHAIEVKAKPMPISQHLWQDNLIKAEHFIYKANPPSDVIVGSSLSTKIKMSMLPGVGNIAFVGQSIYEGLDILSHQKYLPKNVFIEINIVFRKENERFTSMLFCPVLYNLKKFFPSLREEYQPAGFLYQIGNRFIHDKPDATVDDFVFKKLLNQEIEKNSKLPDPKIVEESFRTLQHYVHALESKGVNVVFFEMPVNPALYHSPRVSFVRTNFYKYFPPEKYHYIFSPDWSMYHTSDGLHLKPEEALQYTSFFKLQMAKYLK